jgi:hypothetical protein
VGNLLSKSQPVTQTQNSTPNLPAWLTSAQQGALSTAQGIPTYTPYSGQTVAPLTSDQLAGITSAFKNNGAYTPNFSAAGGAASGVIGAGTPTITAGGVNADTSSFMNPFVGDVVGNTNKFLNQQRQGELQQNDLSAAGAGAFGGNRNAVADALTNYYGDQTLASTDANLENQGYTQAQNTALGVNQANQNATLQKYGLNLSGSNALTGAGTAGTNANSLNLAGLLSAGGTAQQTQQLQDTTNLQQYQDVYNSLYQRLAGINGTLGGITPSNTGTNTTTTGQVYSSPLGTLAGLGLGIAGIAGGPAGAGIASGIKGLFSPQTQMPVRQG